MHLGPGKGQRLLLPLILPMPHSTARLRHLPYTRTTGCASQPQTALAVPPDEVSDVCLLDEPGLSDGRLAPGNE